MKVETSGKSLAAKLGMKAGASVRLINEPAGFLEMLGPLPADVEMVRDDRQQVDLVLSFVSESAELKQTLARAKSHIPRNGAIWVSWPKKGSRMAPGITENEIRLAAIRSGLVDVKVVAIDSTWSGLKLVYRLRDRR